MAQALVQAAVDVQNPGTSVTVNSSDGWSTPSTGNLILAVLGLAASVGTPSIDVTMSEAFSHTQGTNLATLGKFRVSTGSGETAFVGSSSSSDNLRLIMAEFSGIANAVLSGTPVEEESTGTTSLGSGASYTAAKANTLVISVCAIQGIPGGSGPAAPTGFTLATAQSNTRLHVAYKLDAAAGSYAPVWSWTNSLAAQVVTFGLVTFVPSTVSAVASVPSPTVTSTSFMTSGPPFWSIWTARLMDFSPG